jgi:histidinol phosphatase-like enzyme
LKHLKIKAEEMVYVGSKERDMCLAQNQGIYCIHYSEEENLSLESIPPRINTLKKT